MICSKSKGSYWKGKLLAPVCHFCIDLKFLLARICVIENSLFSFLLKVLEHYGVVKGSNARIQNFRTHKTLERNSGHNCVRNHSMHVDQCASNDPGHSCILKLCV